MFYQQIELKILCNFYLKKNNVEKIVINAKERKSFNKSVNKSSHLNTTKTKFKVSNTKGRINSKKQILFNENLIFMFYYNRL